MFDLPELDRVVAMALAEDLGVDIVDLLDRDVAGEELLARDVTTFSTIDPDVRFAGRIVAREDCVVCGLPVAAAVFEMLSDAAGVFEPVDVFPLVAEGSRVPAGTAVAQIDGDARVVLAAERTAVNFLMVLSGIATEAAAWAAQAARAVRACDTRKTLPGLRALSKYAVRVGGATNHRTGLFDMVLLKDNHLKAADGVASAVRRARDAHPELLVEVEADTVEQAVEAIEAGANMVLLDNMDDARLREAVVACRAAEARVGRIVLLEASGNISRDRLASLEDIGIDRVSSSALTLARPVDFALDYETEGQALS